MLICNLLSLQHYEKVYQYVRDEYLDSRHVHPMRAKTKDKQNERSSLQLFYILSYYQRNQIYSFFQYPLAKYYYKSPKNDLKHNQKNRVELLQSRVNLFKQ